MKKLFITAVMAATAFAGSVRADLILGDFTSGTSPVQNWGVASLSTAVPPVAGSGSWLQADVYQYWGQLPVPGWATGGLLTRDSFNSYSKVEFDLILPSAGWLGNNVNISFEVEAENMATTSIPSTAMNVSGLKDQVIHVALDYSSIGVVPASGWLDMRLNFNPGWEWMWESSNPDSIPFTPQTLYLDNLTLTTSTVVPEPGTFALGLLGMIAFARSRVGSRH